LWPPTARNFQRSADSFQKESKIAKPEAEKRFLCGRAAADSKRGPFFEERKFFQCGNNKGRKRCKQWM
jgi:hypothetical protein